MNIAVFSKKTIFHKGYGGMETQNKVFCEGLVKRGHRVTVFSPKWEHEKNEEYLKEVKYIFVDCVYRMGPIFGFFGSLQKSNWINRSYQEFIKVQNKEKFDIVVSQSSAGLGIIRKKRVHNLPVVSIAHGSIIGEYKTFTRSLNFPKDLFLFIKNTGFTIKNFFRRQREFINGSDKVIAVSSYVRNALLEETFTDENRVVVIPNGINPEDFYKKDKTVERGNKLIYIGQVIKSKGVLDLIQIMEDKRFSKYKLDIVGGGDLLEFLKNTVSTNNYLKDKVRILGKKPFKEIVKDFYKNQDYGVFVFPTMRIEGLPMVIVESMFSGLPCVVYNSGGVPDAVFDGETGFVVEAGKIEHFKEKVLTVLENDGFRKQLCKQSLKKAYERFTLDVMLDSYEKVFKDVIK